MTPGSAVLLGRFALTFAGNSRLLAGEGQRVQVPAAPAEVLFQ